MWHVVHLQHTGKAKAQEETQEKKEGFFHSSLSKKTPPFSP